MVNDGWLSKDEFFDSFVGMNMGRILWSRSRSRRFRFRMTDGIGGVTGIVFGVMVFGFMRRTHTLSSIMEASL